MLVSIIYHMRSFVNITEEKGYAKNFFNVGLCMFKESTSQNLLELCLKKNSLNLPFFSLDNILVSVYKRFRSMTACGRFSFGHLIRFD